jgi:spore coat polysaccharide biosynthesis protein SpsF
LQKVVIIIQARTSSTRLRRKALKKVSGKSLIWHVIERAKICRLADQVVLATTDAPGDSELLDIATECRISKFVGDEQDVLSRYYDAATAHSADVVVRMTGDCPLIHPPTVDAMIQLQSDTQVDYVCPDPRHRSLEAGVEVFTYEALGRIHERATEPFHKEHVTLYLREHPESFSVALYQPDPIFQRQDIRLTVDYAEDLRLIRHLYKKFYREGEIVDLKEVVEYLDRNPALRSWNSESQESLANQHSMSEAICGRIVEAAARSGPGSDSFEKDSK